MTEYEKQLKKRVLRDGDKFIFRDGIYKVVCKDNLSCKGCDFFSETCTPLPIPDCTNNRLIFVKEEL